MTYYNRGLTNTGFGTMNKPPPQAIKTVYVTLPARTTVMPGEGGGGGVGGGAKAPKSKKLVYKEVKKSIKKHKRKHSRTLKRKQHRVNKKKRSTKSKIINF